jgi:ABC-type dipeptide/oligopeptide/nickel transport system ATPase component
MRRGIIVEKGPVDEVINSPAADYTQALLDARLSIVPPVLSAS